MSRLILDEHIDYLKFMAKCNEEDKRFVEAINETVKLVRNMESKLAHYEDLEEAGRLIDFDEQVGYGYLTDWYITSVNENDEPVWTEKHIEELISDFVLIPKDKDTVIIAKWTEDKKCSNCSYTALLDGGEEYVFSRYCPNCGVRMTTKEEAEAKLKELEGDKE